MPLTITFGLDISHHQDLGLDLARCKADGIQFVFLKATEGSSFVDSEFATNLSEARAAGLLPAAYHYLRSSAPASAQVAHVQRVVPRDVPVIPDVEANSGGIGLVREFVTRLREAGYRVPLLYLPRWYWQQIGQPSLVGLPPLWSSRYPDNQVGTLAEEWADVPAHYWDGYGGLGVAVLQFTSSARVAGHAPLDANAYRGTREQLTALLGGKENDSMDPNNPHDSALMYRVMSLVKGEEERTQGAGTEQGPEANTFVVDMKSAAGRVQALLRNLPAVEWGPAAGEENVLHATLEELRADVAELKARPAVDVDEAALAAELEARGWDGVTAAEVKEIIRGAFARAGQPEPEGSTT